VKQLFLFAGDPDLGAQVLRLDGHGVHIQVALEDRAGRLVTIGRYPSHDLRTQPRIYIAGEWRAEGSSLASGADRSLPGAFPSFRRVPD